MTKDDWLEIVTFYHQYNWTDWTIFITTLLSPIIMFISVIYAAISAKASKEATKLNLEMYQQQNEFNKLQLKPYLAITDKTVNLDIENSIAPHLKSWEKTNTNPTKNRSSSFLNLINASNNLAKDVKVDIEVSNHERFIQKIIENNIEFYEYLYVDIRKAKSNSLEKVIYLEYKYKNLKFQSNGRNEFNLSNQERMLLVENYKKDESYLVEIPSAFIALYNISFLMDFINIEDLPYLYVVINYKDIIGIEYIEKFIIKCKLIKIKQKIDEDDKVGAYFVVDKLE